MAGKKTLTEKLAYANILCGFGSNPAYPLSDERVNLRGLLR